MKHLLLPAVVSFCLSGLQTCRADDAPPKVPIKEASWKQLQEFVKKQKPDKIVVVDLWSTACLPCLKEFPGLVKLKAEYGEKVVCVSYNLDYAGIRKKPPAYYQPVVQKFLAKKVADGKLTPNALTNFMCTQETTEVLDTLEIGAMPAVLVYRNGKLIQRFDDTKFRPSRGEHFSYEKNIQPYVHGLLQK